MRSALRRAASRAAALFGPLAFFAASHAPASPQDSQPPTAAHEALAAPRSELALVFAADTAAPAVDAAAAALVDAEPGDTVPSAALWVLDSPAGQFTLARGPVTAFAGPAAVDRKRFRAAELAALEGELLHLGLSTDLGDEGLPRLHQQLGHLVRAAEALGLGRPLALVDASSLRWHPPAWVARMAASEAGPAPSSTYLVHAVRAQGEDGEWRYWLHTHGVARFIGSELGCVDVSQEHLDTLGTVVESAASFAVDSLEWPEREPVEVLFGLHLARLPWREGVAALAPKVIGTADDHLDGHEATCVLAVRDGDLWRSPGEAAAALDTIIQARTRRETERGALAARETFADLRAWQKGAREGERVIVKAPLEVEGGGREHVWFEATRLGRVNIQAVLLSQPHGRAALAPGDRTTLQVGDLTGWSAQTEDGSFGPDELEALLVATRAD